MPSTNSKRANSIDAFDFEPNRIIAKKYKIISKLGCGWEGEVYKISEVNTGIERAAKFFFPKRNIKNKSSGIYAKKLHALRECPVVIQYQTQETIIYRRTPVTVLISEYVEGGSLLEYTNRQPGKKLPLFQGIHLLHALIVGIENIHYHHEYHGDLHCENIIVRRLGLSFELKLLDFFHRGKASRYNREDDICDAIRIFYDAIGGQKQYAKHPGEIKEICCGLKRTLILKKFRNASILRIHLENQVWH
jgi:tRNA A-37 threonylcarbamoyl transferase component Bud32